MRILTRPLLVSLAICVVAMGLSATAASGESPQPAGPTPSVIAKEVCSAKAVALIDSAVGESASVSHPTWSNHLYSCTYRFHNGSFTLSVKELSSWAQTYAYFNGLGSSLHKTSSIYLLGQGAFRARNGSIVVRKDWKVLFVNIAGLSAEFGSPYSNSEGVALAAAGVIMGCWNGD